MSTVVPASDRPATQANLDGFTVASWCVVGCAALGLAPQLIDHLGNLWSSPEFQFFPVLLTVVVWLFVRRWQAAAGTVGSRRHSGCHLETATGLASCALLAASVYLRSPWLCAVSAVSLAGWGCLFISRMRDVPGLWGSWALLWLCVPLPLNGGATLVRWLQLVSSSYSSQVLDWLGVDHWMAGNVLHLPGRRLLVDEACSGIVSVMSILACAAVYVVWRRCALVHAVALLLAAAGWAVVMNLMRICTIALADRWYGFDLSLGTPHQLLGLVVFLLTFVGLLGADQLLQFLLAPIESSPLWRREIRENPLIASWNWLVRPRHEAARDHALLDGETTRRKSAVAPRQVWLVAFVCGLLGFYQLIGVLFATPSESTGGDWNPVIAPGLTSALLPSRVGSFQRVDFREVHREKLHAFGEYSQVHTFRHVDKGVQVDVSIDYPYSTPHELSVCYQGIGWELVTRRVLAASEAGNAWNYIEAAFRRNLSEQGFLVFAAVTSEGRVDSPRAGVEAFQNGFWGRLRSRFAPREPSTETWLQMQVWGESVVKLDDTDCREIRELFLACRKRLLSTLSAPAVEATRFETAAN